MGMFDVHCAISGLALVGKTMLVLLEEESSGSFRPAAIPIAGSYDRYGSIDRVKSDANTRAVLKQLRHATLPAGSSGASKIEGVLATLNRGVFENDWGRWRDRKVSFCLIEYGVYRGILTASERLHPDRKTELERGGFDEAFRLALAGSELAQAIYYSSASDQDRGKLTADIRSFAMFRAWGTSLLPVNLTDSCQYSGLRGDSGCQDRVTAASERFAEVPEVLAAIRGNEREWGSLGDGSD